MRSKLKGEAKVDPTLNETVPWLKDVSLPELQRIVDVLYRVHHFISAITDLDTLLERAMEQSKVVAHAEACSLMLYDPKSDELYFHVALGERGDQQLLKQRIRLKLGQGIAGAAAAARRPINVEDVQQSEHWYRSADEVAQFETRSLLAVPLLDRDKLIGVVEVVNKRDGGVFTEADLRVMEIFSGLVATVIANARLIKENVRAERLAAIGEAVAGVSHYAKNVITGMSGSVDLIDGALRTHDDEVLGRIWPILRRSTSRLADFVENMLAFSKPRVPRREPCRVSEILGEAVETLESLLAHHQVEISIDADGATQPFSMDRLGIFRCVLNVVLNAAEAAPRGGGRIWMSARYAPDGALHIEVADNGPGVPEEYLDRVCDPFFSTKGSHGTGLGLAVTSKILGEHGGRLDIERRPGGGALFRMVLPPPTEG